MKANGLVGFDENRRFGCLSFNFDVRHEVAVAHHLDMIPAALDRQSVEIIGIDRRHLVRAEAD